MTTVKELQEELKKYPENSQIRIWLNPFEIWKIREIYTGEEVDKDLLPYLEIDIEPDKTFFD